MSFASHLARRRPLALAAALLVGLIASSGAQASLNASISLSDLRFTLADLTPDDGIAATATFNPAGATLTTFSNLAPGGGTGDMIPFTGLPLPTLSVTDGFGTASISGTAVSLAVSLAGSSDVLSQSSSTGVNVRGDAQANAVVGYEAAFDTPGVPANQFTITLAANSSISFDLSYTATVSLSPQQLADVRDAALAQVDPAKTMAFTFLNADAVGAVGAGFYSGSIFDPNITVAEGSQSLNIDATHLCDGCNMGVMTAQNSSTLSLTYANTTGNAIDVFFLLSSRATVNQNADFIYFPDFPPVEPEVPAIPEPGTWALMGLGLLGLAWARKRHQA